MRGISAGVCLVGSFLCVCQIAHGQPTAKLDFEVASVKARGPVNGPGEVMQRGGPGTSDPGQFTYRGGTLSGLVFEAYDLINAQKQIVGPAWIGMDRFDVVAKVPNGTTNDQFRQMLRNLLTERFGLVVHRETKDMQGCELRVGAKGAKLTESADASRAGARGGSQSRKLDGAEMHSERGPNGRNRQNWTFGQQSTSDFAKYLGNLAGCLTADKTGMMGKYDFTLSYEPESSANPDGVPGDPGLTLFAAIEQQLGLKVAEGKFPFDVVVIDAANRTPADN